MLCVKILLKTITKLRWVNPNAKSNHKVDILEIKKAIYYVKEDHRSPKRLSGEPYYFLPINVDF